MNTSARAGLILLRAQIDSIRSDIDRLLEQPDEPARSSAALTENQRYMTIREFCQFRKVSRRHVYDLIPEGFPIDGHGRSRRVRVKEALKFLAERKGPADVEA